MDLQDFFPSISGPRVQAAFRTAGYPEQVADLLGGLCTTTTPSDIWREESSRSGKSFDTVRRLYAQPHLPQGAPCSPALANVCAYRVDCRLEGLAKSVKVTYTRYADDLAFSGGANIASRIEGFSVQAAAILLEEGFRVHHRKTRIMRQGVRQYLAGLVINERLNVPRPDFDQLKAILTNCVHQGPASQNREQHPEFQSHLQGRVTFMESINPVKAKRLRRIYDQIPW